MTKAENSRVAQGSLLDMVGGFSRDAERPYPSEEIIREFVELRDDTLFWKPRGEVYFASKRAENTWNTKHAGQPVFVRACRGRPAIQINKHSLLVHKVVWLLHAGCPALGVIDHINGDPWDNRVANLRDVTSKVNSRNCRRPSHNTSGRGGVYWRRNRNRWVAECRMSGKKHHIGSFESFEDACAARVAFQLKHGFTARHGAVA